MDKVEIFIEGKKATGYDHEVVVMVFKDTSVEVIAPKNTLDNPENADQVHIALAINHMLANNTELTKRVISEFDEYILSELPSKSDIIQ